MAKTSDDFWSPKSRKKLENNPDAQAAWGGLLPTSITLGGLMAKDLPPAVPIISPWLHSGESCMLWGGTGTGKSMIALTLALGAAGGGEVFGAEGVLGWGFPNPRRSSTSMANNPSAASKSAWRHCQQESPATIRNALRKINQPWRVQHRAVGTRFLDVASAEQAMLNLPFVAMMDPPNGPTAANAGYYVAPATNTVTGSIYAVVGTTGEVYILAITPTVVVAGNGNVTSGNTFAVQANATTSITGALDTPTTTVTGKVMIADESATGFAGVKSSTLRTDRLINLSSRGLAGGNANGTLVTGFVIGGSQPKRVLLRAVGPGLQPFGVRGFLTDPKIRLFRGQEQIHEMDNWIGTDVAEAFARVGAFSLTAGSKDAAMLATLAPGTYTMHVLSDGGSGVTLAEIYDASETPQTEYQRLINISTRGQVGTGEGVLVGGFVVTGSSPKQVLIRGVGPGLADHGVTGVLTDPLLVLRNAGEIVARNDDWETPQVVRVTQTSASATEIAAASQKAGAFPLKAGSKDAALVITLAPGAYDVTLSGASGQTGVALIEVYEVQD